MKVWSSMKEIPSCLWYHKVIHSSRLLSIAMETKLICNQVYQPYLFPPTARIMLQPIYDECFWLIYSRCCPPVCLALLAILGGMLPSTVLSVSGPFIATAAYQCTGRYWPFCSECCQQCDWPKYSWCYQPVWWALLAIFMLIMPTTVGVSGHLYRDADISSG